MTLPRPTCNNCQGPVQLFDELCGDCRAKTPEAIAEREAELDKLCRQLVSPGIFETDIQHPEFNLNWWIALKSKWNLRGLKWLWIYSKESGVCKTRIAYLLTREWMLSALSQRKQVSVTKGRSNGLNGYTELSPTVVWINGEDLLDACSARKQFSLGNEVMRDARETVKNARECQLLVIDDLTKGGRMDSLAVSSGLWSILKERHEHHRMTIFTDNIDFGMLADRLHKDYAVYAGRRLAERMMEADFDHLIG